MQEPSRGKALTALGAGLLYQLTCPLLLLAGEGASAPLLTGSQETVSLTAAIFKTLGSLLLVLGLMLLLLFWIRKMGLVKNSSRPQGLITVLEHRMLGPKKQVSVLEVAGTYLVVGLSEQQITLIATLAPNDRLKEAALSQETFSPLPASFASLLSKAAQTISDLKQKRKGSPHAK